MRYIQFNAADEDKINEFLAGQEDRIAENGVRMIGDRVCILYSELSFEEYRKKAVVAAIEQGIVKFTTELAQNKLVELFWRDKALKSDKDVQKKCEEIIIDASNNQKAALSNIHYSRQLVEEIKDGKFSLDG